MLEAPRKCVGSVMFGKSTTIFADDNIGTGSIICMKAEFQGSSTKMEIIIKARVTWLDWNHFIWEEVLEERCFD